MANGLIPRSAWSAGRDALLDHLAARDQAVIAAEAERRRQEQVEFDNRIKQGTHDVSAGRLSLERERAEREAQASTAAAQRAAEEEKITEDLIAQYVAAAPGSVEQRALALKLKQRKVAPDEPKEDDGLMNVSPGTVVFDKKTGKPVYTAPHRPTAGPRPTVPKVPAGLMREIYAMPKTFRTYEEAFKHVQRNLPTWMEADPTLDPAEAIDALKTAYQYRPPSASSANLADDIAAALEEGGETAPVNRAPQVSVGTGDFAAKKRPTDEEWATARQMVDEENARLRASGSNEMIPTDKATLFTVIERLRSGVR